MSLNTIYQLRHVQQFGTGGKMLENVYFFNHTAGLGVAIDLAQDFQNIMLPLVHALQSNVVVDKSIDVINLGNLGDFYSTPVIDSGDHDAQSLPPYAAVGFTQKLDTRAVRKGSKRISGVPEFAQSNGVITDGGYITAMNNLRAQLQIAMTSVSDTWLPVVLKRVKTAVEGTVPQQYKYRLPRTDGELVVGNVVTCLTSPALTHQTSREV